MAWLAVDKDWSEVVFDGKPVRDSADIWISDPSYQNYLTNSVQLPEGSIEKLIGRKMTWEDEAVEI